MSDGDRFKQFRIGGLVAIAALCVYLLVSDLFTVSASYEQHAANKSAEYHNNGEQQIGTECTGLPPAAHSQCERQLEHTVRQNQREEQDLAAQKVTAWWTTVMGIAALIGMVLSAVGVFLVWTTFGETRKSNKITETIGIAQLRGYLSISIAEKAAWSGQFDKTNRPLFVEMLEVKNWGSTPCTNVRVKRAISLLPIPLHDNPTGIDCNEMEQPAVIWPQEKLPAGGAKAERVFTDLEIQEALSIIGDKRIFLTARVEYVDFTGQNRYSEFTSYLEPATIIRRDGHIVTWTWVKYSKFNDAD